jgi:arylsulfatase A-like enzyme
LDLYPTLCDMLRLPPPPNLDGASLRPLWDGTKEHVRDSVFLAMTKTQRSVRDERWKLIAYPKIGYLQLFDLQSDPNEVNDVLDRSENAEHIARLQKRMKQWQQRAGDTLELPTTSSRPKSVDLTGRPRTADKWQPDWIVKKYFGSAPVTR